MKGHVGKRGERPAQGRFVAPLRMVSEPLHEGRVLGADRRFEFFPLRFRCLGLEPGIAPTSGRLWGAVDGVGAAQSIEQVITVSGDGGAVRAGAVLGLPGRQGVEGVEEALFPFHEPRVRVDGLLPFEAFAEQHDGGGLERERGHDQIIDICLRE